MALRALLGIPVLLLSLLPGTVSSAPLETCADVSVPIRNFKVEAKWQKPSVSIGDTAVLQVLVTRTAEEDPITEEEPWPTGRPMEEPVGDVELGMSMLVGNVFLSAGGVTKADGKGDVKVKIQTYTKPGVGHSRVYAELRHTPPNFPAPSCRVVVYEWGELDPAPKLKVTR